MIEDNLSGTESEENGDSFLIPEIGDVFKKSFYQEKEEAITLSKNYILHMDASSANDECRLALGLSSSETFVYSLATLQCTHTFPAEESSIVNIRFVPDNPSLLYVGYNKGTINLWDLRSANKAVNQFKDTSDPASKNLHEKLFSSFDVNSNGRFLCAGTEVTDGDAFLMFWDTRQTSLLGGYWECHTDDVTQVCFHPSQADRLVTGSTDGLINVYDISQRDEDEALCQSLNTESSVEKLKWHLGAVETVSCITHTADVQLWRTDDSAPFNNYSRCTISNALQMSNDKLSDSLYIADIHTTSEVDQLMVLAGSNVASGRCLCSAVISSGKLKPQSYFDGNKQIVRCSWFEAEKELLVTGGEGGILSVWRPGSVDNSSNTSTLKASSRFKEKPHKTKTKPY